MASITITRGTTLPNSSAKSDFHNLVDTATASISGILNADVDAAAGISASKLDLSGVAQVITMTAKAINEAEGASIASASTTNIWATDGNTYHITGTTTITSLSTAPQAGAIRRTIFDGILTLTHNASTLILPSGANITTAAGDVAIWYADTTTQIRCISYLKADGTAIVAYSPTASNALTGSIVQVVNTQTGAVATGTTTVPSDDSIPQNTEGDEYMTLAITPKSATNKLKIDVVFNYETSSADSHCVALFQDSTADAISAAQDFQGTNEEGCVSFTHFMTAGTTSATTFKVRSGNAGAGTTTFNGEASARRFGGVMASSITIEEIKV